MGKIVTLSQIKNLPYVLALAFACAWMIDLSLVVPQGFISIIPFSRYPHLLVAAMAFGILSIAPRQIGKLLSSRIFIILTCLLCLLGFIGAWMMNPQSGGSLFLPAFICFCVMTICQAILLVACLKAFTGLSMVDCMLTLIAWQFFVAILRAAATTLPAFAISCVAPVIIAVCLTRKSIKALWGKSSSNFSSSSDSTDSPSHNWSFPFRLIVMNALVIFTIQSLQGFSPTPVSNVSYLGLLLAIAITVIVLVINKRIIRIKQLFTASIVMIEFGIIIFSLGSVFSYEAASIILDAAYMAFSMFFFTVLCNFCQRRGSDPIFVFSLAYLIEQVAAFSADTITVSLGPGVHTLPLVVLAGLGAMAFIYLSTEKDQRSAWNTDLEKAKYIDPARYYHTLTDICSSVAMQYSLSKREGDVLLLLAQKKTATQISVDLVVSLATVKTHTHNIYKKMGVHNRQELFEFLGLENPVRAD